MGMKDRNTDIRKRLVKARAAMVMTQPFFASLALRLELKEDPDCATAWTDGKVFAYNPDYIRILPDDKLVGLSAHTVMHPACQHHKRRKGRDPSLWNKACDYAINPILIEAGLALPDGFLYEKNLRGGLQMPSTIFFRTVTLTLKKERGDSKSQIPQTKRQLTLRERPMLNWL